MARPRMHNHTGRFVQHGQVRVLIEELERKRFCRDITRSNLRYIDGHVIPFAHRQVGFRACRRTSLPAAPHGHVPAVDQVLDLGSRATLEHGNQKSIEPLPVEIRRNDELNRHAYAASVRRPRPSCGVLGELRASQTSITMLSGARTSEMNCEVENPRIWPRGSPRYISTMKRDTA